MRLDLVRHALKAMVAQLVDGQLPRRLRKFLVARLADLGRDAFLHRLEVLRRDNVEAGEFEDGPLARIKALSQSMAGA